MNLLTRHGTGDTYMTLAFAQTLQNYMGEPVAVNIPVSHAVIGGMFPGVNLTHDNGFHCHPSVHYVDASVFGYLDHAPTHADIWRTLLKLPPDAPMTRGHYLSQAKRGQKKVFLLPNSNSWRPQGWPPEFCTELAVRLRGAGWQVSINGPGYSLSDVFYHCFTSEWVIGMQCGVMSILCHAQFPCRKTFVTPRSSVGHDGALPVWRFSGNDYDVEEYSTSDLMVILNIIMEGKNAHLMPYTVEPSPRCLMPCTPGDLFDRLSVLTLKMKHFKGKHRAAVVREYLSVLDMTENVHDRSGEVGDMFLQLLKANAQAWEHNELSVTGMLQNGVSLSEHFAIAARHNKTRVELRNHINELCHASGREVKSYYEGDGTS